jgi:hypothetical protein
MQDQDRRIQFFDVSLYLLFFQVVQKLFGDFKGPSPNIYRGYSRRFNLLNAFGEMGGYMIGGKGCPNGGYGLHRRKLRCRTKNRCAAQAMSYQ